MPMIGTRSEIFATVLSVCPRTGLLGGKYFAACSYHGHPRHRIAGSSVGGSVLVQRPGGEPHQTVQPRAAVPGIVHVLKGAGHRRCKYQWHRGWNGLYAREPGLTQTTMGTFQF